MAQTDKQINNLGFSRPKINRPIDGPQNAIDAILVWRNRAGIWSIEDDY